MLVHLIYYDSATVYAFGAGKQVDKPPRDMVFQLDRATRQTKDLFFHFSYTDSEHVFFTRDEMADLAYSKLLLAMRSSDTFVELDVTSLQLV